MVRVGVRVRARVRVRVRGISGVVLGYMISAVTCLVGTGVGTVWEC